MSQPRAPIRSLEEAIELLEMLAKRLVVAEGRAAKVQEESSRAREAVSSKEDESARLGEIRSVLSKIEETRTRVLRLEVALDALESTIASIESVVYER
jgi:hypothetical protein